jgi:hypothetical protein
MDGEDSVQQRLGGRAAEDELAPIEFLLYVPECFVADRAGTP